MCVLRQRTYNVTQTCGRVTIVAVEQQEVLSTVSVCILALGIWRALRMQRIMLSSVSCLYHILPHYLINGTIFGKKMLLNLKCVI